MQTPGPPSTPQVCFGDPGWAPPPSGSPWGRGRGSAAGSQLCLKTIPCPMGGRGLISELDRGQVFRTELAKQLPESPVFTEPPQPQSSKRGWRGPQSQPLTGVSTPSPSKRFWLSDPRKGVKAASSLVLRFKEDRDLWRYIQAYIPPCPSFRPFLLRNSQGHGLCQEKRVAGQSWEGAPRGLVKEFWTKKSQLIPAWGLVKIWLRISSPLASIKVVLKKHTQHT